MHSLFHDGLDETDIIMTMSKRLIYHMCKRTDWHKAQDSGFYQGSINDRADGFLHFSTAQQVAESAARHRSQVADLLLIIVDANNFGPALKWELSRADQLFPHLYGPLEVSKVIGICDLPLGEDGFHQFPDDIMPWQPKGDEGSNV